jgi:hypothetical protein
MITAQELELHAKSLRGEPDGVRLVKVGADLRGANLRGAILTGANFTGAILTGANFTGAILRGANFKGAILTGAILTGANFAGANFTSAKGLPIAADASDRLKAVAAAALQPDALNMSDWHTCGTTHCIAGWAIHLAGEPGRLMESMMGPELAGLLLLGTEAHQHFHDSNEKAVKYLRGVVADG